MSIKLNIARKSTFMEPESTKKNPRVANPFPGDRFSFKVQIPP